MPAWSVPGSHSVGRPLHALPANDDVDLGVLQHVSHVEVAGNVGRRQGNGKGRMWAIGRRLSATA